MSQELQQEQIVIDSGQQKFAEDQLASAVEAKQVNYIGFKSVQVNQKFENEDDLLETVEDAVDETIIKPNEELKEERKEKHRNASDRVIEETCGQPNEEYTYEAVGDTPGIGDQHAFVGIEDDDLLEYGTPKPDDDVIEIVYESTQHTFKTQDQMIEKYTKFPIMINTGNFPYLLTPLSQEAAKRLPSEYEDALNLFDDFSFASTIYEVFQQIRTVFKELDNEFKEEDDLILNFKEFNLKLRESSVYAHKLSLLDIVQGFEALSNHFGSEAPACLHLDLISERSFIANFDDLLKLPPNPLSLKSTNELGFEGEGTKIKPFELNSEDLDELDESLTPEKQEKVVVAAAAAAAVSETEGTECLSSEQNQSQPDKYKNGETTADSEDELLSVDQAVDLEKSKPTLLEQKEPQQNKQTEEADSAGKRSLEEQKEINSVKEGGYKKQK